MKSTRRIPQDETSNNDLPFEAFLKTLLINLQSLVRVIEKENKILTEKNKVNLNKVLDEKEELLSKLQALESKLSSVKITENSDSLKKIADKVSKTYEQLQEVIETNNILLKSNITVSGKIVELYKTKYLEHTVNQLGYNKDGELAAIKKLEKVMPAISLNDKI